MKRQQRYTRQCPNGRHKGITFSSATDGRAIKPMTQEEWVRRFA